MDRQVESYLKDRGYAVGAHAERKDDGGEQGYSEWFGTKVLGLDTEAYRREFWREAYATGHTIGHVPRTLGALMREKGLRRGDERAAFLVELALLQGAVYPFWVLGRLLAREVARLRRGTYYEKERERRWRLADERVAIRVRRTANPRPSLDAVRDAWRLVHATRGRGHALAVLRCGALLEDLEGYVDNHAYVARGVPGIRGRAPGIKGLFRTEAPDLFEQYRNVMRCKALAKRYRQAVGCPDPVPTAAVLPAPVLPVPPVPPLPTRCATAGPPASVPSDFAAERSGAKSEDQGGADPRTDVSDTGMDGVDPWTGGTVGAGGVAFPLLPCLRDAESLAAWMRAHGNTAYLRTREWLRTPEIPYTSAHLLPAGAREEAARILSFGEGTLVAVEAAIALRIDPACVAAEPGARVVRTAGGRRAPSTPRRVREWLAGAAGLRARNGAAA